MTLNELDLILLHTAVKGLNDREKITTNFQNKGCKKEEINNYFDACKRIINDYFRNYSDLPIPFKNVPYDED